MNRFNRTSKALGILAALTCAATAASAYGASFGDQPASVKVSFADLNLATPQGAAVLFSRIKRAARTVCGMEYQTPEQRYHDFGPCYRGAIANAVSKVNSPLLTALHGKSDPAQARTLLTQVQGPSPK